MRGCEHVTKLDDGGSELESGARLGAERLAYAEGTERAGPGWEECSDLEMLVYSRLAGYVGQRCQILQLEPLVALVHSVVGLFNSSSNESQIVTAIWQCLALSSSIASASARSVKPEPRAAQQFSKRHTRHWYAGASVRNAAYSSVFGVRPVASARARCPPRRPS